MHNMTTDVKWKLQCVKCRHEYEIVGGAAIYDVEVVICPECSHDKAKVLRMLPVWEAYQDG